MVTNGDLTKLNTLGLRAKASRLVSIASSADLDSALVEARATGAVHVLGGGSNVVLQPKIPGTLLHIAIKGRELRADDGRVAVVRVGAGENWHDFVLWCHHRGLHGLANLALIPESTRDWPGRASLDGDTTAQSRASFPPPQHEQPQHDHHRLAIRGP